MNDNTDIYIHYGHSNFDINLFQEIKNREFFNKPAGGLWACGENWENNWHNWCIENNFFKRLLYKSFKFKIHKNSRVLVIDNVDKLKLVPNKINTDVTNYINNFLFPDFEELTKTYDAVEVRFSRDEKLYGFIYGWDCDTILIFNKDIIIPLENFGYVFEYDMTYKSLNLNLFKSNEKIYYSLLLIHIAIEIKKCFIPKKIYHATKVGTKIKYMMALDKNVKYLDEYNNMLNYVNKKFDFNLPNLTLKGE